MHLQRTQRSFFFLNDPPTTEIYTLPLHDALPIYGRGVPPAYPPLAGNRALTIRSAVNPIRMVLNGGFSPGAPGNPPPPGSPPCPPPLNDHEVPAWVSHCPASTHHHSLPSPPPATHPL